MADTKHSDKHGQICAVAAADVALQSSVLFGLRSADDPEVALMALGA